MAHKRTAEEAFLDEPSSSVQYRQMQGSGKRGLKANFYRHDEATYYPFKVMMAINIR